MTPRVAAQRLMDLRIANAGRRTIKISPQEAYDYQQAFEDSADAIEEFETARPTLSDALFVVEDPYETGAERDELLSKIVERALESIEDRQTEIDAVRQAIAESIWELDTEEEAASCLAIVEALQTALSRWEELKTERAERAAIRKACR